jgi:hypothetical protein
VLRKLAARGVNVVSVIGSYNGARDVMIANAAIVLNMHYFERGVFEVVRVSYLLANGCAVVSEGSFSNKDEEPFRQGVAFAEYDHLADLCSVLLDRPDELDRLGREGQRIIQSRPMTQYLAAVLA